MERKLTRVVILTYFFPPCNLTAAQRSYGWARHLKESGYYPIVITRNWEHHIGGPHDMHVDSGTELIHEKNEDFEVYYVPFRGNLRDRLYSKYGKNRFNLLRKALSFWELFGHHFTNSAIPFSNLYDFAEGFIAKNKDVKALIVSANPFEIFRFGFLLNRKLNIPWIADYRDDWNTSTVNYSRGMGEKLIRVLERRSERRYVGTASLITSVSPHYVNKISKFTARPGRVILNGFFPDDTVRFRHLDLFPEFTVVYNGMLYPSQQIEVFLDAFKAFADRNSEMRSRIRLRFPGILFLKDVAARVASYMRGYEDLLVMTERVSRDEVLEIQGRAHLLLMVSHKDSIGIPSSKIYEYLSLEKPVLICPGDGDILNETFEPYNIGYVANTADEALGILEELFTMYLSGSYSNLKADSSYTAQFTRQRQSQVLAGLFDKLIAGDKFD